MKKDLRAKKLVSALPPGMAGLQITMEVRVYRERPIKQDATRGKASLAGVPKRNAQTLWEFLCTQHPPKAS